MKFESNKSWLKFLNLNKAIVEVVQEGRLYKLVGVVQSLVVDYSIKLKKNNLWHHKLGHVFMYGVIILAKFFFIKGLNFNGNHDLSLVMDVCIHHKNSISFEWGYSCKNNI